MSVDPGSSAGPLRVAEHASAALWSSRRVGLLVVDASLTVLEANPCAVHALGLREDGRALRGTVVAEDCDRLERGLGDGGGVGGHYVLRAAVPGLGPDAPGAPGLVVSVVRVPTPDGRSRWLLLGPEYAAEWQRERMLRQASRYAAVGKLTRSFTHDISNALNAITTLTELMLMDAEEGSDAQQDLSDVKDAAWAAAGMVTRLRRLTVSAGGGVETAAHHPQTLAEWLEGSREYLRWSAGRAVALDFEVLAPELELPAEVQDRLFDLLLQMTAGAAEALPGGGAARLSLGTADSDDDPTTLVVVGEIEGAWRTPTPTERAFEPVFDDGGSAGWTPAGLEELVRRSGGSIAWPSEGAAGRLEVRLPVTAEEGSTDR